MADEATFRERPNRMGKGVRIGAVVVVLLAAVSIYLTFRADDPTSPPYAEVVSHLHAIPAAPCSGTEGTAVEECTWGWWTLTVARDRDRTAVLPWARHAARLVRVRDLASDGGAA